MKPRPLPPVAPELKPFLDALAVLLADSLAEMQQQREISAPGGGAAGRNAKSTTMAIAEDP